MWFFPWREAAHAESGATANLAFTQSTMVHDVKTCVRVAFGEFTNMSSGLDLRKRVKRQDPHTTSSSKRGKLGDPLNAIDAGSPGEVRISSDTMVALHHLYQTSPSIQAARAILMGQLLSSGVVVQRAGRDVNLKPVFSRHLEDS